MSYKKSKIENGETRYVASTNELEHLLSDDDEGFTAEEAHFLNRELLAMYQVQKWLLSSIKEIDSVVEMYKDSQEEVPRVNATYLRDETLEKWRTVVFQIREAYNFIFQEYKWEYGTKNGTEPRDTIRSMVESQDHIDNVRKAFGEELPLSQPRISKVLRK